MFGKTLSIVLLLLSGLPLNAQTDEIQERILQIEQRIISGELSEEKMFSHYEWLMYEYATMGKMEKVRDNFQKVVAFAREKKPDAKQRYYARMGSIFSFLSQKDSALVYFNKAVQLLKGNYNWAEWANVYELMGNHFAAYNDQEKATNAYMTALEMNEKDKVLKIAAKIDTKLHIKTEVRIRLNIEVIRGQMLNHENVLEAFLSVKKLITENSDIDFSYEEYIIDANIADEYIYLGEYEKALPYIRNSYEKAMVRGDLEHLAYGLIQLSIYHQYKRDYQKALGFAKEALKTAEEIGISSTINLSLGVLVRTFVFLKDYQTALYHTKRQLAETGEDDHKSLAYIYSNFALIYAALGDMRRATENIGLYDKLKSKVSDEHMHNAIQNMEVKYNVQQKEMEIERQQVEIRRQKTRHNIYMGGLLGAGLLMGLLIYVVWLHRRRNRTLTETNATKDQFFSIISHDLKNPATAQRDAIQVLFNNASRWDSGTLTGYCGELLRSADNMVELLYNLLNWAQVQTNRMTYQPRPFDLSQELGSDLALIRKMAENKGVMFETDMPPQAIVNGDTDMMLTVVRNLLTNAVKFTPKGGTVKLAISPVSLFQKNADETDDADFHGKYNEENPRKSASSVFKNPIKYTVSVADTGIGIDVEGVFNTPHPRRGTAGEPGTGLGLIVCKELLEKHKSQLHVESRVGEGSKFWFELNSGNS